MFSVLVWLALSLCALLIAAFAYVALCSSAGPDISVAQAARGPRQQGQRRIVCAGDSLTRGNVSFDYVRCLQKQLGSSAYVINAGVNGDLAYNLAERMPSIVSCAPDDVIVLIGTNDLCGAQTPGIGQRQRRIKQLPELPTQAFFERQLTRVLSKLAAETNARIFVVTPPLLGEDLSHPVHARLEQYAQCSAEIAQAHGARLIAFHTVLSAALRASGHTPRPGFYPGLKELAWMALVPLQRHLARMSYDRIAHKPRVVGLTGFGSLE